MARATNLTSVAADPAVEPLGLLHGAEARAAIAAGVALPLGGGAAFTLTRVDGRVVPVASLDARSGQVAAALAGLPPWIGLPGRPLVMGILNVTPDSFTDGGDRLDAGRAVAAGCAMVAAGADLLDIGGESTRPGALPVDAREEQARILPVLTGLRRVRVPLSVDTRNATTMAAALAAGASIVNDVSALTHDPDSAKLLARERCGVVLMHMRGTPATMAGEADYKDVAEDVRRDLAERLRVAVDAGIAPERIALDPGMGFAKPDVADNVRLLQRLPLLRSLGRRLLVGVSRKTHIGVLGGETEPRRRDPGSLAAGLFALSRGASILRVHDVVGTVQAVRVWQALVQ